MPIYTVIVEEKRTIRFSVNIVEENERAAKDKAVEIVQSSGMTTTERFGATRLRETVFWKALNAVG